MAWPSSREAAIQSLGTKTLGNIQKIKSIVLLGSDTNLNFQQTSDSLRIQLPSQPLGKQAHAFRVVFQQAGN